MRSFLLVSLCFVCHIAFSQKRDKGPVAYITEPEQKHISVEELANATELKITDTTITIVGFFIMIQNKTADPFFAEIKDNRFESVKDQLNNAKPGGFIIIGNIRCKVKGGIRTLVGSLTLEVICKDELKKNQLYK